MRWGRYMQWDAESLCMVEIHTEEYGCGGTCAFVGRHYEDVLNRSLVIDGKVVREVGLEFVAFFSICCWHQITVSQVFLDARQTVD